MKQERRFQKPLLFILPALLFLTACEAHATFAIEDAGTVNLEMQLQDDSGLMQTTGITCDTLKSEIDAQLSAEESAEIEVVDNSSEEMFDCSIHAHSSESAVDGQTIIESDDSYILKLESAQNTGISEEELQMLQLFDYDFTFTVQMPGKIVRAEGAQISGNQAVYSDLATLINGIEVEGKKVADPGAAAEAAQNNPANQRDEGLSWGVIAAITAGILLLAAILLVIFLSRRRKNQQKTVNPYESYTNPTAFAPFGDNFAQNSDLPKSQPQNFAAPANNFASQNPQMQQGQPNVQNWQNQQGRSASSATTEFFSAPAPQQPFSTPNQHQQDQAASSGATDSAQNSRPEDSQQY